MTQYICIDSDGDKWVLKNGRWVSETYTSLTPTSTRALLNSYGGSVYIVVEDISEVPELPEEPIEIGRVHNHNNRTYVRCTESGMVDKPWVESESLLFLSWEDIHG